MMLLPAERHAAADFHAWATRTPDREGSGSPASCRSERSRPAARRLTRLVAVLSVVAELAAGPAFGGAPGRGAVVEPAPTTASAGARSTREPSRRLSKFEARKIRHACYGRANERGLTGAEREAFLTRCYFGRVSHRAERQQCRQQAAARGVERAAMRDFMRECVRERTRQKE